MTGQVQTMVLGHSFKLFSKLNSSMLLAVGSMLLGHLPVAVAATPAIAPVNSASTSSASASVVATRLLDQAPPELPALSDPDLFLPTEQADTHLVLRLGQRRVFVQHGEQMVASYPVAIGKQTTPTPTGEFTVFEMVENPVWQSPWTGEVRSPGANSALGLRWIGFARMPNGVIGFHGTPTVSSIGRAASNGCVRMRNEDVLALFNLVQVGTVVRVEP
jgi:lipoprotein-anchoring transpeptidase ErfK/SrfK